MTTSTPATALNPPDSFAKPVLHFYGGELRNACGDSQGPAIASVRWYRGGAHFARHYPSFTICQHCLQSDTYQQAVIQYELGRE